jgi:hypothetical protein
VIAVAVLACQSEPAPVPYPPITLQEELRIRNPSESGPALEIGGAELDRDGSLYLVDATMRQVLVFDSTGKFSRAIGRGGEQPGEFSLIGSVGLLADTVWVSDPRLGRITLFSRDGRLVRTMDNSGELPVPGIGRYSLLGILGDGSRLVAVTPPSFEQDVSSDRSVPFLRVTDDGKADTLFSLPIPGAFIVGSGRNTRYIQQPFDDRPTIGVRRDGLAWVEVQRTASRGGAANVVVTRYSLGRGKEWSSEIPVTPVRIPSGIRDSIVNAATANPMQAKPLREWLRVPRTMPLVSAALMATGGTVWLNEASRSGSSRWIRLDPEGNPTGAITIPRQWSVLVAGDSVLWTFEKDSAGVNPPSIARYRIR